MTQPPSPRDMFDRFVAANVAASGASAGVGASPRAAANQVLVRRYFEMWNTGDGSVADAVLGPTYLDHAHPEVLGPAAFRSLVPRFRAANPGAAMKIEIAAADDDFVAVRNAISRTVDGRRVESEGVALFRIVAGKLAEQWSCYPDAELDRSAIAPPPSREAWLSFRA
jgi:predicted SnoaL-like aldol condensation-catalyzing enzyme